MRHTLPATRRRYPRFAPLLLVASVLASAISAGRPGLAQDAKIDSRSELILTNLPPKGSKAYNDLLGRAGKDANGQVLGFTRSEMWSMPTSRIEDVIRKGETLGVKMTRLGADWNQVLKPPSAPMAMSGPQEAMMKAMTGSKETMGVGMMASPNAAVVEYALMKDYDAKSSIGKRPAGLITKIVIPINARETITVRRTSVDMKKDGCTWRGEIEGTGEPVMLMWWKGGRFNGMFTYRGHMYSLKNMGGEVHAVVETDPGKMPPDHGSMPAQPQSADVKDDPLVARGEGAMMRPRDRSNLKDRQDSIGGVTLPKLEAAPDPAQAKIQPLPAAKRRAMAAKEITIDLMVLYTSKVFSKYIDIDKDLIALSVEQANESFANSGLRKIKLRLVHSQLIDYDESDGEHFNHLYRMVDGEGPFKGIRKLRNEKRADVVALIVDDASGCGLSTRVGADADEAFVVVHHSCAALTYSIAHEVGHIIGARHDISLDKNVTPFAYGHGYVNGKKWRDIMSYKASCDGCPRVPVWSNPTIKFKGDPAGTLDADNARVILEQAERVSKFR
jgi:metallopeptidase family M12-like protein